MAFFAGLLGPETSGIVEAVMAGLFTFLAWWMRDQSAHIRTRLEQMDAERWAIRADVERLKAQLDDLRSHQDRRGRPPRASLDP
jgi:cell division protein FtsB